VDEPSGAKTRLSVGNRTTVGWWAFHVRYRHRLIRFSGLANRLDDLALGRTPESDSARGPEIFHCLRDGFGCSLRPGLDLLHSEFPIVRYQYFDLAL
jgi:hypothetical protein